MILLPCPEYQRVGWHNPLLQSTLSKATLNPEAWARSSFAAPVGCWGPQGPAPLNQRCPCWGGALLSCLRPPGPSVSEIHFSTVPPVITFPLLHLQCDSYFFLLCSPLDQAEEWLRSSMFPPQAQHPFLLLQWPVFLLGNCCSPCSFYVICSSAGSWKVM